MSDDEPTFEGFHMVCKNVHACLLNLSCPIIDGLNLQASSHDT